MVNRRTTPRRVVQIDVVLQVQGSEVRAHTRDLSVGGMFVITAVKPAIGSTVRVRLVIPTLGSDDVVDVVVRWTSPDGIGVQFGALRAIQTWAIQRAVRASLGSMG